MGLTKLIPHITAGVRRLICGVKLFTPAVGLRQILNFEINFINTAGVRRTVCGVKNVRPAGLISGCKKYCMWGKIC